MKFDFDVKKLQQQGNLLNCVNGVNGKVITEPTRVDIENIMRALENSPKIPTEHAVRISLLMFVPETAHLDIASVYGWISRCEYPVSSSGIYKGELGAVCNIRVIVSEELKPQQDSFLDTGKVFSCPVVVVNSETGEMYDYLVAQFTTW